MNMSCQQTEDWIIALFVSEQSDENLLIHCSQRVCYYESICLLQANTLKLIKALQLRDQEHAQGAETSEGDLTEISEALQMSSQRPQIPKRL